MRGKFLRAHYYSLLLKEHSFFLFQVYVEAVCTMLLYPNPNPNKHTAWYDIYFLKYYLILHSKKSPSGQMLQIYLLVIEGVSALISNGVQF